MRIIAIAAIAAFFVSGCSSMSGQQRFDLVKMQLEQQKLMAEKPIFSIQCSDDKPCPVTSLQVYSEMVQHAAATRSVAMPESDLSVFMRESRGLVVDTLGIAANAATTVAPLYFMADIAATGMRNAGGNSVVDSTHAPTVVEPVVIQQAGPLVVDPVVVPQYVPVAVGGAVSVE